MLREIKRVASFEDGAEEPIANALQVRNALAHDFFRKHDMNFCNNSGRRAMIEELCAHIECLMAANMSVDLITGCVLKLLGFTLEEMAAAYAEFENEAKKD
jgi:hypothetical protein